jgi:Ni,Fe-hydrogenase III component G
MTFAMHPYATAENPRRECVQLQESVTHASHAVPSVGNRGPHASHFEKEALGRKLFQDGSCGPI